MPGRLGCRCPVSARNWSATCSTPSPSSAQGAPARRSLRDCASEGSRCAPTASCGCCACPIARSARSPVRSNRARGSPTSRAGPRSPRSTPHIRRFSVHPLQTLVLSRGPEQLDGAWGAVTGEDDEARTRALWLAESLGLRPFPLADGDRALYHAGAAIASNFLVTLYRVSSGLLRGGRRSPRGARASAGTHDRERVRADGADRTRRLGDGGAPPRAPCAAPGSSRPTTHSWRRHAR